MNALDVAYMFAAGVTAPWWARKTRGGWDERLGRTAPALGPAARERPRVLLHAVSVGETSALRQLVPLLADRAEVVVTATTDTGMARARELYGQSARVLRYPLDLSGAVKRFLDAVRPDVVGLVELEVWPNFLAGCARRGIAVAVINGRLSARSFRGYRRFRWAVTGMFRSLAVAAVQDEAYAQRFIAMGTPRERVRVTGSMKWDSASFSADAGKVADLAGALGVDRSRPVVVGGSTAEADGTSEEALLDGAMRPGVQLICAPRKPERFEEAYRALGGPARCVRRSNPAAYTGPRPAERFLLDTIGELRSAYALADVAVIGRSFGALHGSDPVEPIALGKATVMGPAAGDFLTTVEAFERAGAIVRCGAGDLAACVRGLLNDPDRRADLGRRGVACVRENQGASARHAEILLELAKAKRDGGGAATNDAPGRGQVVRTAQSPPEHTGGRLR